jgi:hypothetical protein
MSSISQARFMLLMSVGNLWSEMSRLKSSGGYEIVSAIPSGGSSEHNDCDTIFRSTPVVGNSQSIGTCASNIAVAN